MGPAQRAPRPRGEGAVTGVRGPVVTPAPCSARGTLDSRVGRIRRRFCVFDATVGDRPAVRPHGRRRCHCSCGWQALVEPPRSLPSWAATSNLIAVRDCCSSRTIRRSAAPPRSNAPACTATEPRCRCPRCGSARPLPDKESRVPCRCAPHPRRWESGFGARWAASFPVLATCGKTVFVGAHLFEHEWRAAGRPSRGSARSTSEARPYGAVRSPEVAEITGAGREWTVSMISELSIPWR